MPTDGWEMYQPPLYYLIAAASLSAANSQQTMLHRLSFCVSSERFRRCAICFGFFKFAPPAPVRAAFIGLLFAAFLPMHLYLAHYVTNEMLQPLS